MMRRYVIIAVLLTLAYATAAELAEAQVTSLWPDKAPGAMGNSKEDRPSLKVFLPPSENATGTGVVICPGGAYYMLMYLSEGEDIAHWLNSIGVAGFVLSYRLAPRYHDPAPREDVLRAIRYVRYHKADYGLAEDRIGVIGFSAGGHVAATAATQFGKSSTEDPHDPVDAVSDRPDFAMLIYPVITFLPPFAHEGSALNLLGSNPSENDRRRMSAELNVTAKTPPAFLFHTDQDAVVPAENSVLFYQSLRRNHVPAELHIFEQGQHGVGLANGVHQALDRPVLAIWPKLAENWMCQRGLLPHQPCGQPAVVPH